jgi:hypothetical protein
MKVEKNQQIISGALNCASTSIIEALAEGAKAERAGAANQ